MIEESRQRMKGENTPIMPDEFIDPEATGCGLTKARDPGTGKMIRGFTRSIPMEFRDTNPEEGIDASNLVGNDL